MGNICEAGMDIGTTENTEYTELHAWLNFRVFGVFRGLIHSKGLTRDSHCSDHEFTKSDFVQRRSCLEPFGKSILLRPSTLTDLEHGVRLTDVLT